MGGIDPSPVPVVPDLSGTLPTDASGEPVQEWSQRRETVREGSSARRGFGTGGGVESP